MVKRLERAFSDLNCVDEKLKSSEPMANILYISSSGAGGIIYMDY